MWRDWAASDGFCDPLRARLSKLGLGSGAADLIRGAKDEPGWIGLARLDSAARLVESLARSGSIPRGSAGRILRAFLEGPPNHSVVPENHWSARPAPAKEAEEQLAFRGAVLVRVKGRRPADPAADKSNLAPSLLAALRDKEPPLWRRLAQGLRSIGPTALVLVVLALLVLSGGVVLEGLLLRGAVDLGRELRLTSQRLGAVVVLLTLTGVLSPVEWSTITALLQMGRRLEVELRRRLLEKLPRLHDRYFQSRPVSDMAERAHALYQVRLLPQLLGRLVRIGFTLAVTGTALTVLDPVGWGGGGLLAGFLLLAPLAAVPVLVGLDLKLRTHLGALARFHLDALLGLSAVRAHGAERSVRAEHEGLLSEWARVSLRLVRWVVFLQGVELLLGSALAAWLVVGHASPLADTGAVLLLAYWALQLPLLGEEFAQLVRQYPTQRNILTRPLLEPLRRPGGTRPPSRPPGIPSPPNPLSQGGRGGARQKAKDKDGNRLSTLLLPSPPLALLGRGGWGVRAALPSRWKAWPCARVDTPS